MPPIPSAVRDLFHGRGDKGLLVVQPQESANSAILKVIAEKSKLVFLFFSTW